MFSEMNLKKRSLKTIILIIVIGISMILCSCVDQSGCGKEDKKPKGQNDTLVATSPSVADICSRLDLDLVGVCDTSSSLPERYKDVKKVGMPMNPDPEIIKSINPDYILSPATLQNDLEPKYQAMGMNYIFMDLKSVPGMYKSITEIGEKFGKEKEAKALNDDFDKFMKDYKKSHKETKKPKVLILMGLPGSYIVATENSYVGSLVELAGGENVFSGTEDEFIKANTEEIKLTEPDVILRAAHGVPDEVKVMFAEEFETNQIWKHFKAVQNGRVYDLDSKYFNMSATFGYKDALEQLDPMLYGE